jgi:hypothetical protein
LGPCVSLLSKEVHSGAPVLKEAPGHSPASTTALMISLELISGLVVINVQETAQTDKESKISMMHCGDR